MTLAIEPMVIQGKPNILELERLTYEKEQKNIYKIINIYNKFVGICKRAAFLQLGNQFIFMNFILIFTFPFFKAVILKQYGVP